MTLIVASTSVTRQAMLIAAGVPHDVIAPGVDEGAAKQAFAARGLDGRALADALAELKAVKVSNRTPGRLVLGCDQTLERDDGLLFDKPGEHVAEHLRQLSGRTHYLYAAAVVAEDGRPVWRHVERVSLVMRTLSDTFIEDYVRDEGTAVAGCVGGYRIEGRGAQLFDRIDGSHFAILGLPLLPLLRWLRDRHLLVS